MRTPLSATQARELLNRQGLTVADFARMHDLNPHIVYRVLAGTLKGRNGEAHKAAVLLRMKKGVIRPEGEVA